MKYFIRYEIKEDGTKKEIKVPEELAIKQIRKILKEDKELLEILEKL